MEGKEAGAIRSERLTGGCSWGESCLEEGLADTRAGQPSAGPKLGGHGDSRPLSHKR